MTAEHIAARGLRVGYGGEPVIHGVDASFARGSITVIVGANASGKSTLLRGLARLAKPDAGFVVLDGADLRAIPTKALARRLGLLPQQPTTPEAITVAELVARGRHPHRGLLAPWSDSDERAVVHALAATGTTELADRAVDELSGGQRQRVWIAMVLAQETEVLLLDEPTTYLDVTHQLEVLDLVRTLNRERGTTVVMVLHDLSLAARYADELLVLADGEVVAHGAPRAVVTPALLRDAFGLEALVIDDPSSGTPLIVPVRPIADRS